MARGLEQRTVWNASCDAHLRPASGSLVAALLGVPQVRLRCSLLGCPPRLATARLATTFKPFAVLAWGDVRLVELGPPDKRRPAVILTRSSAIPFLHAVTVAPVTRTVRGIPTEIVLGQESGLKETSVANLDAVQTVSKQRIGRYLGSVSVERKAQVRDALLFALELNG